MRLLSIVEHWNIPGYNIFFEISALLFVAFTIIKFLYKKRFPTHLNRFFLLCLICAALDIAVDITASVFVNPFMDQIPVWLNSLFNGAFYILQVWFPSLLFICVLILLGPKFYKNFHHYLFLIPTILFTIMILINPFTHWVYYFAPNTLPDSTFSLMYCHGPLFLCYYITACFYFIVVGVYTAIFHKYLEKRAAFTIYISLGIIFAGIIIQIIFPDQLLTGITIAAALFFIEDNITNPDDMIDKISGVFNFNALMIYLERTTRSRKRNYIISVDVESTQLLNETLGIVIGNTVYSQIGNFFNTLNKNAIAFRLFSSKFVLLFKTQEDALVAIMEIQRRFKEPWYVEGSEFILSCTMAEFNDDGKFETSTQFLNYASTLTDNSKRAGINNVLYVDAEYLAKLNRESQIQKIIGESLLSDCHGFSMNYQPILNTKTGKFTNAEALIRFKCDEFGMISPGEFVPLAEKAGFASQLDEYVLKTVCKFMKNNPELDFIEINVSGAEFFTNPATKFMNIIKESGVDPHKICFEITETAAINYPHHTNIFMRKMKEFGVCFAIDDFGTGYSNVSQLLNEPFDIVKLDKTLLEQNEKTVTFLHSITDLFKKLNYPLVIEGIETEEQKNSATELGFEYIQGYYFSRPLTEENFLKFLKENNK